MVEQFVEYDGARLRYEESGAGPSVVLVHGFACSRLVWSEQTAILAKRWRVIVPELAGHGLSQQIRAAHSMEHLAEGLHAVLHAAGAGPAIVVGHSMGASVARYLAEAHPESVKAMVAIDSRSLFYGEAVDDEKSLRAAFAAAIQGPNAVSAWRARIDRFFVPSTPAPVRETVHRMMPLTPVRVTTEMLASLDQPVAWSERPLDVPVLAVYPKPVSPEMRRLLGKMFPRLEYHEWEAGHFLMMERPADFHAILEPFLVRQTAR
jgi:pimeloyl-ACP methyl ester carboxylesterase